MTTRPASVLSRWARLPARNRAISAISSILVRSAGPLSAPAISTLLSCLLRTAIAV
jgi:hypothetical protein